MSDSSLQKEIAKYGSVSEDTIVDAVEIVESVGGTVLWQSTFDHKPEPFIFHDVLRAQWTVEHCEICADTLETFDSETDAIEWLNNRLA